MTKFGFPELEMEGVPGDSAAAGRKVLIRISHFLIQSRNKRLDFNEPLTIPGTDLCFKVDFRAADSENHFPAGSFRVRPKLCRNEQKATSADSLPETQLKPHTTAARKSEPPKEIVPQQQPQAAGLIKARLLDAHRQAKEELPVFRKSFLERKDTSQIHAVKVAFPTDSDQYEWMWVSLDSWRGRTLFGYLENVPQLRKDLLKGSRVQINQDDIFDWVVTKSGAVVKGGYTEYPEE